MTTSYLIESPATSSPEGSSLAAAWFVRSLRDGSLDSTDRRARFGVGAANASAKQAEFAELFAPRFRAGVELQR